MNDVIHLNKEKKNRELKLATERRRILSMTPEQALEAIADHPLPVTLVQSFSEEDLYFLIHHIGTDDALPIIGMASNEQWEYLVDMEVWNQSRPDDMALTRWFKRLLKADPDRFTHWIIHEQQDLLELYLFRNVELFVREYEQDPAEVEEGFFSEDQVHYIRLRKLPDDPELKAFAAERDAFILDLLKRIAVYDLTIYQTLLLESAVVLPAESEEEQLRLRHVRLAEKGFLPFDEAIGVYQPLTVEALFKQQKKPSLFSGRPVESYPIRTATAQTAEDADLFVRTLAQIQDDATLDRLQAEFAGLCNQIISADQKPVRTKDELSDTVDKVSGYLSLALEKIASKTDDSAHRHTGLIQTYLLSDIFRVGYGCALSLKWQVDQWRQQSWFQQQSLPLSFWGEAWLGILGGLLLKKPLFFDNYTTGVLYREFKTLADINVTQQHLDHIIAMDQLLSLMAINLSTTRAMSHLTYANLLLTLWANHHLGFKGPADTPHPLTLAQFRKFFDELWEETTPPRRISTTMRELFLTWLAQRTKLAEQDISQRLGHCLENLFQKIEAELGAVPTKDLDPRYVYLFLFKQS